MGKTVIYITILEGCLTYIFQLQILLGQDLYSVLFITINTIFVFFLMAKKRTPRWLGEILFASYFLKILWLIFMYFDLDTTIELFKQRDAIYFFHPQAMEFLHNPQAEGIQFYSKIIACFYLVFGEGMRIPVYYNILCSLYAELIMYKIFTLLDLKKKTIYLFTSIYILLPWKGLMSLYMQREAIPTLLVVLSIYYFALWLRKYKNKYFLYCFINSMTALLFHAGLMPLVITYIVFYIIYDAREHCMYISRKNIYKMVVVICVGALFVIFFGEALITKLLIADITDEASIQAWSVRWTEKVQTGSLYLTWLQYSTITDVFVQAPLRAIYFLYSPLPWDFRGIQDVLAFSVESMLQLVCMFYVINNYKFVERGNRLFVKVMFIMFVLTALLFGIGTFESGTALRHRAKFVSILLLMAAITYDGKRKGEDIKNDYNRGSHL